MGYGIVEHKHAYATWAASRAWGRGLAGADYERTVELLTAAGMHEVTSPAHIGTDVDQWLIDKMELVVEYGHPRNYEVTFGRAQKLINIYLKTVFVCGGFERNAKVKKLHPPLDRELFKGIRKRLNTAKYKAEKVRSDFLSAQNRCSAWTQFSRSNYEEHIAVIKAMAKGRPLWMIEEDWRL